MRVPTADLQTSLLFDASPLVTRPLPGVAVDRIADVLARPEDDESPADRPRLRAIFISDLHIGTPGFQADALLDFLKHHRCDTLYLVGDIVDGWQLRRRWFWPQSHNDVVQKLLRRARKGCRVIYVPGNHDEFARHFVGHAFGGVEVVHETVHTTATGLKLWVIHGDHFDGVIQCAKWLAYVGDWLYEFTLKLNRYLNRWRARMGLGYWSLSAYLKLKVKKAVNFISDFEVAVAQEAKRRGYDGAVCGHIHHAEIREWHLVLQRWRLGRKPHSAGRAHGRSSGDHPLGRW
jgi:UDP-2,3-diacylglucosamine pyrophosphatase LpxH